MTSSAYTRIGKMQQSNGLSPDEALELVRQYLNGEIEERDLPEEVKGLAKVAYAQKEAMKVLFLRKRYVEAEKKIMAAYNASITQQRLTGRFVGSLEAAVNTAYNKLQGADRALYRKLNETLKDTEDAYARWYRGNNANLGTEGGRRSYQETIKLELDSVLDWMTQKGFFRSSETNQTRYFHAFGRNAANDVENWFRDSLAQVLDTGIKAGMLPKRLRGSLNEGIAALSKEFGHIEEASEKEYLNAEDGKKQLKFGMTAYAFCVLGEILKDIGDAMV